MGHRHPGLDVGGRLVSHKPSRLLVRRLLAGGDAASILRMRGNCTMMAVVCLVPRVGCNAL